ncbi:hypothetical protein ABPG75_008568 [Micractinium tetrahymenae]
MEAEAESETRLRAAICRAGKVRAALAELREQAFASAAAGMGGGPGADSPACRPTAGGTAAQQVHMLPVLLLPQGLAPASSAELGSLAAQLAPGTSMASLGDSCGRGAGAAAAVLEFPPLLGPPAGDNQLGQYAGERHASPKTSRPEPWAGSPVRQLRAVQPPQGAQRPEAAGASVGASFEEVLAALRAEGLVQLPDAELAGQDAYHAQLDSTSPSGGRRWSDYASRRRQAAAAARRTSSSSWSLDSGGAAGRGQRPSSARQRQAAGGQQVAALPTFDPVEAERRLKAKLDQVHAAKRGNDSRVRPAGSSCGPTPGQQQAAPALPRGVPRLPLASLSRAGSAASSRRNSGRLSSRENDQQVAAAPQQQWRPWQVQGSAPSSPATAGQRPSAASTTGERPASELAVNLPPLLRDDRSSAATGAGSAVAAGLPQLPRKESRISLPQLLSSTSGGSSGPLQSAAAPAASSAAAQSSLVVTRHSAFSVAGAASAAVTTSSAAAASSVQADGRKPADAAAAAAAEQQAAADAAPHASGAVRRTSRLGSGVPGLGQLRSQLSGVLQSPPATPLEAVAQADPAAKAGPADPACGEKSPGQVSTASSGSPEQQHQQAAASPLRTFPLLGDEEALQQAAAADGTPPPRQQQYAGCAVQQRYESMGVAGTDRPAGGERSASSIGRKRANSEAGCSEGPASVKKRSPEVGSKGQLAAGLHAEQRQPRPAVTAQHTAAVSTPLLDGVGAANGGDSVTAARAAQVQQVHGQQQERLAQQQQQQQGQQEPAGLPAQAAAPPAVSKAMQPNDSCDSLPAGFGRLVIPVVLQHSPPQQLRRQAQQHAEAQAPPAAAAQGVEKPAEQQVPAATKLAAPPAPGAGAQAPKPVRQQQQQGAAAEPTAQTAVGAPAAAAAGVAASRPARPAVAAVAKPVPPPVTAPLPDTASPRQELPSLSQWVDARSSDEQQEPQQQQQEQQEQQQLQASGSEELEMPSTSVLIGGVGAPQTLHDSPGQQQQRKQAQQQAQTQQQQAPQPSASPPVSPLGDAAAAATAATTAAAAAAAAATIITPRRRASTFEPPETALCLREDPQGKQLLEAAPKLASMPAGDLLAAAAQGCMVRKAWVRPNFKQGGSTRRIQLAPGSGGRAEMLYPSGLFRKPLRFALRRAVVASPAWRPGQYIVLDTAKGMLRLEPGSAADHARWVLALNAAFLASDASPASSSGGSSWGAEGGSSGGSGWRRTAVRDLRWSAAILLS